MTGRNRLKDGVASASLSPVIYAFSRYHMLKTWMAGTSPAMTKSDDVHSQCALLLLPSLHARSAWRGGVWGGGRFGILIGRRTCGDTPHPRPLPTASRREGGRVHKRRRIGQLHQSPSNQILLGDDFAEPGIVRDELLDEFVHAVLEDVVHVAVLQPVANAAGVALCRALAAIGHPDLVEIAHQIAVAARQRARQRVV